MATMLAPSFQVSRELEMDGFEALYAVCIGKQNYSCLT
jgi:hypothetical protein